MALGSKSRISSSESTHCSDSGYAPSSGSHPGRQRESPSFPFFSSLQSALLHPRILECLLSFISYEDFNALTSSCSELRNLMDKPALKDTILSCFLPAFPSLLRFKNHELFVDVRITIRDLNIFHLSDRIGLHAYPIHALQFGAGSYDAHQLKLLHKLQCFTTVHSKFILLLQSLAHSSLKPLKPELEDIPTPRLTLQTPLPPGIRELQFPEPLSYTNSPTVQRTPSYGRHRRSRSTEVVMGASGKKRSFFKRSRMPLPPPSSDFIIRQSYFSPWRRILESSSSIKTPEPTSPRRRRFINSSSWSDSSLSTSTRLSIIQEKRRSTSVPHMRILFQSPHDTHLATSRLHAPVLRVFVPCSELNDISIAACEDQLTDAGLWDHLSVGDIVCNLGYMPPFPLDDGVPQQDPIIAASTSMESPPASLSDTSTPDDTIWLVYDGFGLVPYSPIVEPPPLKDALTLVTPYYYSHILPSSAHPFFTLDLYSRLSRFRGSVDGAQGITFSPPSTPRFELVLMPMKVRSPKLPGGFAMVKRHRWVATIKGMKAALSGDLEVGIGWLTDEWALEVDGTCEGRRTLESLLYPSGAHIGGNWARGEWVWEVDRQKSGLNTTWLRLLGSPEDYVLPLDPTMSGPTSPMPAAPLSRGSPGSAAVNQRRFSFMAR